MVAAQWGEIRDPDARTGGGVSGRFRPLGDVGAVPDTTPPPFGTSPWGYRRSEVDAWASWVAGLVAHGRNESIRADSAEATLRATLERLQQLEHPAPETDAPDQTPAAGRRSTEDRAPESDSGGHTPGPGARTAGRLHFDAPGDLPRRVAGRAAGAFTSRTAEAPDATECASDMPACPQPDAGAPTRRDDTTDQPRDHDLARLHVVETTLHEVLELLHHLADRKRS